MQQAATAASTVAAQQAAQSSTASPTPSSGKYTGEPISVNLKDVDLKDFFRLIHEISGLNVVLDPNVKGTLTIVLDEVPWDQALDIVLVNNSLDKQLNGNVLRVATKDTLKKEAETARDLQKAQAEAVAPITITRVLSYAKATTVRDTLKKFLSSRGDIFSDDRSNQLIIRDIPSNLPTLDNLIHQLDRKSQQVEIEARVVQATRSFSQDIGVQWGFAGTTTSGRTIFGGTPQTGISPITTGAGLPQPPLIATSTNSSSGTGTGLPLNVNLPAGAPTSGFYFGQRSPNFAVDLYHHGGGSEGRWKTALQAESDHAEQRKGYREARYKDSDPDDHQQHDFGGVHRRGAEVGSDSADYRRRHRLHGRGRGKHPDRQRYSPRSRHPGIGYAVRANQGACRRWRDRRDWRHYRHPATDQHHEVPVLGSLPVIGRLFREQAVNISSSELLFFLTPRIIPG